MMEEEDDGTMARAVGDDDIVRTEWTGAGQPSVTVVEAVAVAKGRDPVEGPPLQRSVDVGALNELVTGADDVVVSFRYDGVDVTVTDGGMVRVEP